MELLSTLPQDQFDHYVKGITFRFIRGISIEYIRNIIRTKEPIMFDESLGEELITAAFDRATKFYEIVNERKQIINNSADHDVELYDMCIKFKNLGYPKDIINLAMMKEVFE